MYLKIGEKFRCALHFIEDGVGGVGSQESSRVARCKETHIRRFQIDIREAWKQRPRERRFAGLPGADDGNNGIVPGCAFYGSADVSCNHNEKSIRAWTDCQY